MDGSFVVSCLVDVVSIADIVDATTGVDGGFVVRSSSDVVVSVTMVVVLGIVDVVSEDVVDIVNMDGVDVDTSSVVVG